MQTTDNADTMSVNTFSPLLFDSLDVNTDTHVSQTEFNSVYLEHKPEPRTVDYVDKLFNNHRNPERGINQEEFFKHFCCTLVQQSNTHVLVDMKIRNRLDLLHYDI